MWALSRCNLLHDRALYKFTLLYFTFLFFTDSFRQISDHSSTSTWQRSTWPWHETLHFIIHTTLWNGLPAALRRPFFKMTLHTVKRQLKAYLFHVWCVDEQKERPPPPDAVVAFFMILAPDTKLLTYLLTNTTVIWLCIHCVLQREIVFHLKTFINLSALWVNSSL